MPSAYPSQGQEPWDVILKGYIDSADDEHQSAAEQTASAEVDAHVNDASSAHDASAIDFTPAGTISATNVQEAIEEVASEAGGGGGAVDSVNGETGVVVLDAADVGAETPAGAQTKADTAESNAEATAAAALNAHETDITDAHDASAISFTPAGSIEATDVQAAIEEVAAEAGGTAPVDSVNGQTGVVVLDAADVGAETPAGAQTKADTAESNAEATAAGALSSHEADTTSVHGIADTSVLELTSNKGAANGYAPLGADQLVPDANLPTFEGETGAPGPPGPVGYTVVATVDSGTYTLNPSNATEYTLTASGDFTLATSGLQNGHSMAVELIQDSTGSRTVTLPSDWIEHGTVTLTTTADTYDILGVWKSPLGTHIKQFATGESLPSGFWSPTQLADPVVWYSANSLPLEDGENPTVWPNEFAETDLDTVEGTPTMKILNGEKYIEFNATTSDAIRSTSLGSAYGQPLTICALVRINGTGTQPVWDDGNNLSGFELFAAGSPQNWQVNSSDPNALVTNGDFQTVLAVINSASGIVRVDSTEVSINTGGKTFTTAGLMLGRNQPGTTYGEVDIAEVFAFNHTPGAPEIADIENYLNNKRDALNGV